MSDAQDDYLVWLEAEFKNALAVYNKQNDIAWENHKNGIKINNPQDLHGEWVKCNTLGLCLEQYKGLQS